MFEYQIFVLSKTLSVSFYGFFASLRPGRPLNFVIFRMSDKRTATLEQNKQAHKAKVQIYTVRYKRNFLDTRMLIEYILLCILVHASDELVDELFSVTGITTFDEVLEFSGSPTSKRVAELEWPQEVTCLLEVLADGENLVDKILD